MRCLQSLQKSVSFAEKFCILNTSPLFSTYKQQVNGRDRFLFFAPGRINLIGDHTDYTGGRVLPAAISVGTWLFVRLIPEKEIRLRSENLSDEKVFPFNEMSQPQKAWTDYPMGVLHELMQAGWQRQGLELIFHGDLPMNAGLSSSASIEMVTAFALNVIFSLGLSMKELALLSQRAEHRFVGVHCGIMDQYTIAHARPQQAILLDCHSVSHTDVRVNFSDYEFIAVNSGVKHQLSASVYNQRVAELKRVREVINSFFDVPYLGLLSGEDHEWLDKLVEDPVLKKRLRHVVNENTRTDVAAEMLEKGNAASFGRLMYDSHNSLAFDFEVSCKELDTLVKIASETEGVVGARMTGAGFGGCTVNLVHKDALKAFSEKIVHDYHKATGREASVYPLDLSGEIKMIS
jgi:galactokinase